MPKIINAYSGNESIAENLKGLGEAMFGNGAKSELERQQAAKYKRENEEADALPESYKSGNLLELGGHMLRGNPSATNIGGVNLARTVLGPDGRPRQDYTAPDIASAAMGDKVSAENTMPGLGIVEGGRASRNAATIAGENHRNEATIAGQMQRQFANPHTNIAEFTDDNGEKMQLRMNPQTGQPERLDAATLPQMQPSQTLRAPQGGFQPTAAPGESPAPQHQSNATRVPSPTELLTIPPAPAGANTAAFRKAASTKAGTAVPALQDQAEGALKFLAASERAKGIYTGAPDVFGPHVGTENYNNYVRAPAAALHLGSAQENMGKYNDVESVTKELSSSGLKARYGARPTNIDLQQNNSMFGGLRTSSNTQAVRQLERMELENFATLRHAIQSGAINPAAVPPEIAARGIAAGALDPRFFPNVGLPHQTAAPVSETQSAPQAPFDDRFGAAYGNAPAAPKGGIRRYDAQGNLVQ